MHMFTCYRHIYIELNIAIRDSRIKKFPLTCLKLFSFLHKYSRSRRRVSKPNREGSRQVIWFILCSPLVKILRVSVWVIRDLKGWHILRELLLLFLQLHPQRFPPQLACMATVFYIHGFTRTNGSTSWTQDARIWEVNINKNMVMDLKILDWLISRTSLFTFFFLFTRMVLFTSYIY